MKIENEALFNVKKGEGGSISCNPKDGKFIITAKKFKQYLTDDGVGEKEIQVNLEIGHQVTLSLRIAGFLKLSNLGIY